MAESSTLKGRRFGNVILVGSAAHRCRWPTSRPEPAGAPFPYRVLHGARLTQLLAGARPFTDQDAEASPAPPRGMLHFG